MGLIIFLLIICAIFGDRKNLFGAKQLDTIKKIIFGIIGISIVTSLFSELFPLLFLSLFTLPAIIPIAVIIMAFKKSKEKRVSSDRYRGSFNQADDETGTYYGQKTDLKQKINSSGLLPKAASKRRKIIEKFNKKYELYLTESQIQRMVDASYYSSEWEKEIADMAKEYNSIYEWFQGDTAWLRAYLKVFHVQTVSSDFKQQKQICFSEFDQIFSGVDFASALSNEEVIMKMNDKFFTDFNEISFMIAYRFLEANGRKYNLARRNVVTNEDEIAELEKKYRQMPSH